MKSWNILWGALLLSPTLLAIPVKLQAQDIIKARNYPQQYFRSPLDITPQASGTFGELRSTHFHAGNDYRTQQRVGLNVYAVADGYVSRVRVQIGGGGLSVYITHPNGYTSVYLHMDRFNASLAKLIKEEQYRLKRYDVDMALTAKQVPLTKGQVIGLSGNTGGSGGPHLHFEIRDTKTQNTLNSQLFGLQFADNIPPTIRGITLYDLEDPIVNEHTPRRHPQVKALATGKYGLVNTGVIPVNGKFSVGINTNDRHSGTTFTNGIYSIELTLDNKPVSTVVFEELSFASTRAIYSYVDYAYQLKTKVKIQKSFRDPGNPVNIFKYLANNGIMELKDQDVHELKYVVKDVKGNSSELTFKVQNKDSYQPTYKQVAGVKLLKYNAENTFSSDNLSLKMGKNVLYNDLNLLYSQGAKPANGYSQVQHVHNTYIPVLESYKLGIKADSSLPKSLTSKALIVSTQGGAQGGFYENGWVTASVRTFGSFYIAVDTIAPKIVARNLTAGKHVAAQKSINFTISDNLSGIQSINGYVDGKWVLFEYDPKNRHIWHTFDDLPAGSHELRLEVTDWKDNTGVYTAKFTR